MILSTSRMHVRDLSRPVAVYVTSMQKMTALQSFTFILWTCIFITYLSNSLWKDGSNILHKFPKTIITT